LRAGIRFEEYERVCNWRMKFSAVADRCDFRRTDGKNCLDRSRKWSFMRSQKCEAYREAWPVRVW
jgi:hypothetical protein